MPPADPGTGPITDDLGDGDGDGGSPVVAPPPAAPGASPEPGQSWDPPQAPGQSWDPPQAPGQAPVLEVRGVAVRFGGVSALTDVNLTVSPGTITGLIGPNGAGKTTLFNVISGLQRPNRGQVIFQGLDITGLKPHRRARLGIARTFQRLELFGTLTAEENVQVGLESAIKWWQWRHLRTSFPWARGPGTADAKASRRERRAAGDGEPTDVAETVDTGGAAGVADTGGPPEPVGPGATAAIPAEPVDPDGLPAPVPPAGPEVDGGAVAASPVATAVRLLAGVGIEDEADELSSSLPTGHARMVELARGLAIAPKLLLLDEPGSGLDEGESAAFGDLLLRLASEGISVLLVEHDMDLVMRICDTIHVLDFGEIIASGSPDEIRDNVDVQAAYLGTATAGPAGAGPPDVAQVQATVEEVHARLDHLYDRVASLHGQVAERVDGPLPPLPPRTTGGPST